METDRILGDADIELSLGYLTAEYNHRLKEYNKFYQNSGEEDLASVDMLNSLRVAIMLLQLRIPKEPNVKMFDNGCYNFSCPMCGNCVGFKSDKEFKIIKVCSRCGKVISEDFEI